MSRIMKLLLSLVISFTAFNFIGANESNTVYADSTNAVLETDYLYSRSIVEKNGEVKITYGSSITYDFKNNFCKAAESDESNFTENQLTTFKARISSGADYIRISGPLTNTNGCSLHWKTINNVTNIIQDALTIEALKSSNGKSASIEICRIDGNSEVVVLKITDIKIEKANLVEGVDYVVPTFVSDFGYDGTSHKLITNSPGVTKDDEGKIGEMWFECDMGYYTNDPTKIVAEGSGEHTVRWFINSTDYYNGVIADNNNNPINTDTAVFSDDNKKYITMNVSGTTIYKSDKVIKKYVTVTAADLSKIEISGLNESYIYTGNAIEPKPKFIFYKGTSSEWTYDLNQYNSGDFQVTYSNNINVTDSATITISAISSNTYYTGSKTATFKIIENTISVSSQDVTLNKGTAGTATFTVTPTYATGQTLPTSYDVSWYDAQGNSASVPTGVTIEKTTPDASGAGTISVKTTTETPVGEYYFKVNSGTVYSELVKLTVSRTQDLSITIPTNTAKTYDGETLSGEITQFSQGSTVYYKTCDTQDGEYSEYSTTAPSITDASILYVKAIAISEDKNHESAEISYTLQIDKRTLLVTGTTVADKTYDGTKNAEVTLGTVSNKVVGDDVEVTAIANFDSAEAGTNKVVSVTYSLSGAKKGNYSIDNADLVANINKADGMTITDANDFNYSKKYDGVAFDYTPVAMVNSQPLTDNVTFIYKTSTDGVNYIQVNEKPTLKDPGTLYVKVTASTNNYKDSEPVYYALFIEKRNVYLKSESITKAYDPINGTSINVTNGIVTIAEAGSTVTFNGEEITIDGFLAEDNYSSTPVSTGYINRMGVALNKIPLPTVKTEDYYSDHYNIYFDGFLTITEPENAKYHIDVESLKDAIFNDVGILFEITDDEQSINQSDEELIKEKQKNEHYIFLNIDVYQYQDESGIERPEKIYDYSYDSLITFSYDFDFSKYTIPNVCRVHHDSSGLYYEKLTTKENEYDEYIEYDLVNNKVIVHARYYSTYALAYDTKSTFHQVVDTGVNYINNNRLLVGIIALGAFAYYLKKKQH